MSQATVLAGRPVREPGAGAAAETCRAAIAPCVWEGNRRCRQGFLWAGLVTPGLFPAGFLGTAPPANVVSVAFRVYRDLQIRLCPFCPPLAFLRDSRPEPWERGGLLPPISQGENKQTN